MVKKTELIFLLFAALIIGASMISKMETSAGIDIQEIHLDSIQKIIEINDSLVIPVVYDTLLIDHFASAVERKKQFINQVLPAILIVRYKTENKSRRVEKIIKKIENNETLRPGEVEFADSLMNKYRAKTYENLLVRLKPTPTSLVLAQAAIESGWGSSRFAIEGNNLFGVWGTSSDNSVIESRYNRGEKQIYLKKYNNIAESIDHYFLTLGRHRAYRSFRLKRYEQTDVYELIDALDKYSENGKEYTLLLKKVIEWNNLEQYDHYIIDPEYIIKDKLYAKLVKIIKRNN